MNSYHVNAFLLSEYKAVKSDDHDRQKSMLIRILDKKATHNSFDLCQKQLPLHSEILKTLCVWDSAITITTLFRDFEYSDQ